MADRRHLARTPGLLLLLLAGTAASGPAAASTAREDLVRAWLDAMAFGAPVSIGAVSFNPAETAVELTDVAIGAPDGPVRLSFPSLVITDPRRTADGDFAAHAIRVERIEGEITLDPEALFGLPAAPTTEGEPVAPMTIGLSSGVVLYERVVTPLKPPALAPDADIPTRVIAHGRWFQAMRADWMEANDLEVLTEGAEEGSGTTHYDLVYGAGLHDGRIERFGFNGLEQTTLIEGARQTTTIGASYGTGLDNGALLDALDPATYVNGKGDGVWRTVLQQYRYTDVTVAAADTTFTAGSVQVDGARVRQTERPLLVIAADALKDPAAIEADPVAFLTTLWPNVTGFYGLDGLSLEGMAVEAPGVERLTLQEVAMNGMDSAGIGSITARGFDLALAHDGGAGKFNQVTFGNIVFGDMAAFLTLAEAGGDAAEGEVPPAVAMEAFRAGSPRLDFMEMTGFSADVPGGTVSIDTLAATNGDFLQSMARRLDVTLTNLVFPVALLSDPEVVQPLEAMEYEQIALSGGATVAWDTDRGRVHVEDVTLRAADMGVVSMDAELSGLPLSILDDPATLETRLDDVALVKAAVTFGNLSLVERIFAMKAKEANQDPDTFRQNFAGALPLMLSMLGDKAVQDRFTDVLKDFFADPKSISATVAPTVPLPFSAIGLMQADGFGPLADALNLAVTANE
ncbi:hypothetical protein [Mongoliimonas terrestris]|uniref:hypothetical protein n=1 Tax=Mongoliimonas terrestris TaxID=1709001 RepID=UPI0009499CDF|nr:hypothetical protein [Mongoliimonas terrestris]